jgi:hypothetical protein
MLIHIDACSGDRRPGRETLSRSGAQKPFAENVLSFVSGALKPQRAGCRSDRLQESRLLMNRSIRVWP